MSVNDAFVMKAWGKDLDADKKSGIRFLADPDASFTKALGGVDFDATPILGNVRSKRYAIVTEDGKVKSVHIEPDNTGILGTFSLTPSCGVCLGLGRVSLC